MKKKTAVILHNQVDPDSPKDELDVLVQVEAVHRSLDELGYRARIVPFSLDVDAALRALRRADPLFVFNLVESVAGDGRLIHLAPALLDHLGLPYTGSGQEAIFVTSNKVLSKRLFQQAGIPTPPWVAEACRGARTASPRRVVPARMSRGPTCSSRSGSTPPTGLATIRSSASTTPPSCGRAGKQEPHDGQFFAERYIEGREFNQALLAGERLPAAEMRFVEYPEDKLRIVDFRAKWEEDSFEYAHTRRSFDFALPTGPCSMSCAPSPAAAGTASASAAMPASIFASIAATAPGCWRSTSTPAFRPTAVSMPPPSAPACRSPPWWSGSSTIACPVAANVERRMED